MKNISNVIVDVSCFVLYFIAAMVVVGLLAIYMGISCVFHYARGTDKNVKLHRPMDYWS